MSQIFYMILTSFNSILFTKMVHPMNMGLMLLTQTLLMCLMTSTMSQTSWFSYILFLVFLGGMLVLFIYMTSIASNEMFQKSNYLFLIFFVFMLLVILIIMSLDSFMESYNNTNESLNMLNMFNNNEKMMMMSLYNNPTSIITLFMVLYLFLTLIIIVHITKSLQGPLRPMY